jgi:hypothetical protein
VAGRVLGGLISLDPGRQWLGWNLARVAQSSVTRTDAIPS